MRKITVFILQLITAATIFGQVEPIVVAEQTIKVGKKKELFYSFAKGDEIVFDLQVVKGKNLKEIEIVEYPHSSKFFDFKTKKISAKKIKVNKTAIYKFRFKGGGIGTKVCRAKILRIPASNKTANFDTSVKWKVRVDSVYVTRKRKILIGIDTNAVNVADRLERVHSTTNLSNSNVTRFSVNLPQNQYSDLQTSEVISWAYWVGVGNEGEEAYKKEKKKFLLNTASKAVASVEPLSGLALGTYAILSNPPKGDNTKYWITTFSNGIEYSLAQGNSIVATGRITDSKQGTLNITLQNDNLMNGINVKFKVSTIVITKKYGYQSYQELQIKQHRYPVLSSIE